MSLAFNIFIMVQFKLIMLQGRQNTLKARGSYPYMDTDDSFALSPLVFDPILRRHDSEIESCTWITFPGDNNYNIQSPSLNDMSLMS
jgi:hypothetical protein